MPVVPLPTIPQGEPACPAALRVDGACESNAGVVCRVIEQDLKRELGTGMTAGQLGVMRESTGGVFLTMGSDPSTVMRFCFGDAVPVLDNRGGKGRDSYTYCPVWQAELERLWEGKDRLTKPVEPDPVSMGVDDDGEPVGAETVSSSEDPWAARRALDDLAPPQPGELLGAASRSGGGVLMPGTPWR